MAINFNKHRDSLQAAWKDVLDDKTDIDWALFGYDGQSNDLALVGKGDGGLEELAEDLNSGKIMYAFVKVNDTKTSLHKFVLINWQGEGANTVRKGICANHLLDVERFFTGHHLTISARNDEEVEPDSIIEKVANSGSAYSFKAPRGDVSGPTNAIGTNYKRVNPVKEINAKERDQFWQKEEQEERKRVEEERRKREAQRLKHEEDLKKRDLLEAAQREVKTEEHNTRIDQIKEAQHQANVVKKKLHEDAAYGQEDTTRVNLSDVLRQQRNMETQELISRRTIDARSVFEKNTSAGQIKCAPEKPVRHSLLKQQQQQQNQTVVNTQQNQTVVNTPEVAEEPQQSDEEPDQFSTIKRSPKDIDKKSEVIQPETIKNNINSHQEIEHKENIYNNSLHITEQQFVDEVIYQEFADGPGLQARALYDYQAADDTEITFDPGDVITNIDQVDEGWWQGLGPDGTYGLFPANYVELIE